MMKLSVVVITLNEERNIARCLDSVKDLADEIFVVDSMSKDKTVSISEQYGARIILQPFLGHIEQKNFAAENAINDWVLSIDADEVVTDELKQHILSIKQNPEYNGYSFPRLNNYCGKWIRHSGWYPDQKIRLFNRTKGMWKGENPHDRWTFHSDTDKEGKLKGDLLHYSFYTISDHIKKIEKYTDIAARKRVEKGKSYSILKIWFVPKWKFFIDYFIRLGFLDGYEGYLVCRLGAMESIIKYSKTRQYADMKKRGIDY